MKISPVNSISFTSTPLYNVKLKKQNPDGTISEVPATFSKLNYNDRKDRKLAENLQNSWSETNFARRICSGFLDKRLNKLSDFYVIERKNKKGKKEIFSIAEFYRFWNSIEYLQANPKNKESGIKGAGEVMLWGIAKENGCAMHECFNLISTEESEGFYEHVGLTKNRAFFHLSGIGTKAFLRRIEKKYNYGDEQK